MRVFEAFAGVGMTVRGIENSKVFKSVDVVGTSETNTNAIISYAAIHNGLTPELLDNYDKYPSRSEMAQELTKMRIGYNWEKDTPYNWEKVAKSKDSKKLLQKTWLACKLNNNFGDICGIEHLPVCDLLTYTSPCTDYSVAGTQSGNKIKCNSCGFEFNPFEVDVEHRYSCPNCGSVDITSTRSGLMVEIERLVLDAVKRDTPPKYLLQENVDALVSNKFIDDFNNWIGRLDKLGYNTYWEVINLKNCSTPETPTPQNRKRLFSISILKEIDNGTFEFNKPFDCGLRMKDILLDDVDEKYFLTSDKAQKFVNEYSCGFVEDDEC